MKERSYGWVVVLCAFTLMFVGFGAAFAFMAAAGMYVLQRGRPSRAAAA